MSKHVVKRAIVTYIALVGADSATFFGANF